MKIRQLQTPARVYGVVESESDFGGRTFSLSLKGVVWGDFRPDAPAVENGGEGEPYVVQAGEFLCRRAGAITRGGRLRIRDLEWTVVSLDEAADGTVRVRIERVHP